MTPEPGQPWPPTSSSEPPPDKATASDEADRFFLLEAPPQLDFAASVERLFDEYDCRLRACNLSQETEVFVRFHLSDAQRQAPLLQDYLSERDSLACSSVVGQPSATGSKVALLAYHLRGTDAVPIQSRQVQGVAIRHGGYRSLWLSLRPAIAASTDAQTEALFADLDQTLRAQGLCLSRNLVRTWIYVRDIDRHYAEMAATRRSIFKGFGLTPETHYVASTGIQGRSGRRSDQVIMDALAIGGLEEHQVTYLQAPEYLCPTHHYNVTFERGTQLSYGDRQHYVVSGTASIDHQGQVLFPNDVVQQTERALTNINALLSGHQATLADLNHVVVYLRDLDDAQQVQQVLARTLPRELPRLLLWAPVCRPSWRVEVEGMASRPCRTPGLPDFAESGLASRDADSNAIHCAPEGEETKT